MKSPEELTEIRSSFHFFDEDKSQRLEYDEFKKALKALGFDVGPETSEIDPKFQAILDIVDINRFVLCEFLSSCTRRGFISMYVRVGSI